MGWGRKGVRWRLISRISWSVIWSMEVLFLPLWMCGVSRKFWGGIEPDDLFLMP